MIESTGNVAILLARAYPLASPDRVMATVRKLRSAATEYRKSSENPYNSLRSTHQCVVEWTRLGRIALGATASLDGLGLPLYEVVALFSSDPNSQSGAVLACNRPGGGWNEPVFILEPKPVPVAMSESRLATTST